MATFGIRALRSACQPAVLRLPELVLRSVFGGRTTNTRESQKLAGVSHHKKPREMRESAGMDFAPRLVHDLSSADSDRPYAPSGFLNSVGAEKPLIEDGVTYKVAGNQRERAGAFRVVYQAYTKAGLMPPNAFEMRVMPHHLLPTTIVFVAMCQDRVIATMSLVGDGRLGLPLEDVYGDEVSEIRQPSCWLGEVSGLASSDDMRDGRRQTTIRLMQMVAQFSRYHGVDRLLIAVHPRHAKFYCRGMGFQELGGERPYPAVSHRPAVALHLDLSRVETEHPEVCDLLFGRPIGEEHLRFLPISTAERRFFAAMIGGDKGLIRDDARSTAVLACA